jgi:hypothetical protein
MKAALGVRSWQLIVLIMTFAGPLLADSTGALYPGFGTTINGNAVYFGTIIKEGYQVKTAGETSLITYGGAELAIYPNTTVIVGEPLVLTCGTVVIRSGSIQINDGRSTTRFQIGQSVHSASTSCGTLLPDAPSVERSKHHLNFSRGSQGSEGAPAPATGGIFNEEGGNWLYWSVNGAMLGSSVLAADLTQKCLEAGACTFVPHAFHSHIAMYGAGLPAAAGVAYLSYRLKAKRYRWWFVPAALVTTGNIVVSVHAAHYSH